MPFRDIVGHRHLLELVAGAGRAGIAAAEPDLRRPRRRREARRGRGAGAARELPDAGRRGRVDRSHDACGTLCRPARASRVCVHARRARGRARRHRRHQGRSGARGRSSGRRYRPFEGRRRVVIVDEADAMLSEAQNALLKTLEEPPSASMFVLVTSRPDDAAADGAVALSAAAVRPAVAGRGRRGADARARLRGRPTRTRRPRRPTAASALALEGGSTRSSRRARPRPSVLQQRGRRRAIRAGGSRAPSCCSGRRRSRRAAAPAAGAGLDAARPGRDSARRARTSECLANADLRDCRCGGWPASFDRDRVSGRLPRSIARSRRSIATRARRSSPTGWRFSCR